MCEREREREKKLGRGVMFTWAFKMVLSNGALNTSKRQQNFVSCADLYVTCCLLEAMTTHQPHLIGPSQHNSSSCINASNFLI